MLLDKYPIFQQAYLVNDLDEAAKKWNNIFGAGHSSTSISAALGFAPCSRSQAAKS